MSAVLLLSSSNQMSVLVGVPSKPPEQPGSLVKVPLSTEGAASWHHPLSAQYLSKNCGKKTGLFLHHLVGSWLQYEQGEWRRHTPHLPG